MSCCSTGICVTSPLWFFLLLIRSFSFLFFLLCFSTYRQRGSAHHVHQFYLWTKTRNPLVHDTGCDFTTLSHLYGNKTKRHSHAAHKTETNEWEHMQITWQFLTEATVKKQAFLVHNNYCKTLENPWGTSLCQWLKRLMITPKAAHRDKSKI